MKAAPATATAPAIPADDQRNLYYALVKTRRFDERCRRLFKQGRFPGTYFSAVGQEATTVGPTYGLTMRDVITTSHREIGAAITKGMPLVAILRQIYARADSPDKGHSHPCHFGYPAVNLFTPASTVAAQTVVGTGMALAFKMRREPHVVLNFFGEGATARGGFHEALNFAGVHDLPIVFICENNLWAESVPARLTSRVERFSDRAKAYGFPGVTIDGNDLLLTHTTARDAIARAREGKGPTLIECLTYRWYGHSEIDPANYRESEEVEYWKARDPLARFEQQLEAGGIMTQAEREAVIARVDAEIEEAIGQAEASPHPPAEEALNDVYSFSPARSFPIRLPGNASRGIQ